MIKVPQRFLVNNRPPDQHFEENESLYLRFSASDFDTKYSDRLPVAAIKFPDVSVNREKYSQPSDVLIPHWINHGIAEIKVKDIPKSLMSGNENDKNAQEYEFKVEHDPIGADHPYYPKQEFENYAHSEIRAFKDGIHQKNGEVNIPKSINKKFRIYMSDKLAITKQLAVAPLEEE